LTIEINTSFYGPPKAETCRKWLEQVAHNERFLFTAKLSERFTHRAGATAEDERDAGKLGAVLLQFPFSFHHTPENVAYLKKLLARFADYPLVVEGGVLTSKSRHYRLCLMRLISSVGPERHGPEVHPENPRNSPFRPP
jgi:uncharacterized protein YecE (DUF72 family)